MPEVKKKKNETESLKNTIMVAILLKVNHGFLSFFQDRNIFTSTFTTKSRIGYIST